MKRLSRHSGWAKRGANLLEAISFLSISAVVAGALGRWHFLLDLASHFRIQATIALLVSGALLWLLGRRRWAAVSLCFGGALSVLLLPYLWPQTSPEADYRLLTLNVLTRNQDQDRVIEFILRQDADFVMLQETDAGWIEALDAALGERWPHRKTSPRNDNFGIALYSQWPWSHCDSVEYSKRIPTPSIRASITLPHGEVVRLIVTHPVPPMNDELWRARNELFEALAKELDWDDRARTIVAGDLNCTPWSPHFGDLLARTGLRNSAIGEGLGISWIPIPFPAFGLPIDHVLVGREIVVENRWVGPDVGSDHRPVVVDFDVRGDDGHGETAP